MEIPKQRDTGCEEGRIFSFAAMVDLSYIRDSINKWGQCKTLSISQRGAVALFGRNGYATCGQVPADCLKNLEAINENGYTIDEVTLRDDDSWVIIYDDNQGFAGHFPQKLGIACKEALDNGAKVLSADWIPVRRGDPICCIGVNNPAMVRRRKGLICVENAGFFSHSFYCPGNFYYGHSLSLSTS